MFKESLSPKPIKKGEGFTMEESRFSRSDNDHPGLQFRPEETEETALKRTSGEKAHQQTNPSPEEKLKYKTELRQRNIRALGKFFREQITKRNGVYSETLLITSNGEFNWEERHDGRPPFITTCDVDTSEDLYTIMHEISQENPDLEISFENDSNGTWIKYTVTEKK